LSAQRRQGDMFGRLVALVMLAAALGGCAATRLDASVHTVGHWPAGRAPGSFAFERLPSQEAQASAQDRLEAAALPALAAAGFRRAEGGAVDVRVQLAARTMQTQAMVADPFYGPFWGGPGMWPGGWRGAEWGYGAFWGMGPGWGFPYHVLEVALLIVDARSGQALYETRAQSDGSAAGEGVWAALVAAALKDFPYAAVSPRTVTVDLVK
jgi:hypothetical protein